MKNLNLIKNIIVYLQIKRVNFCMKNSPYYYFIKISNKNPTMQTKFNKYIGNFVKILQTHLLNSVSSSCAECGSPSTIKSNGNSLATAAIVLLPSLCNTAAASLNCLPSDRRRTRRRTSRGLVGDARSRRIRSPHSLISPQQKSAGEYFRCCFRAVQCLLLSFTTTIATTTSFAYYFCCTSLYT